MFGLTFCGSTHWSPTVSGALCGWGRHYSRCRRAVDAPRRRRAGRRLRLPPLNVRRALRRRRRWRR